MSDNENDFDEQNEQEFLRAREERRQLRKEQRQLLEVLNENRDEMADIGSSKLNDFREKNNELFKKTKFTREQLNDAQNLKQIAKATSQQSMSLEDMSRRYCFDDWAISIKSTYENKEDHRFSWNMFGQDVGTLFLRVPRLSPMLGPITNEIKHRMIHRKKIAKTDLSVVRPEEQEQEEGEQVEATNERIGTLYNLLHEKGGVGDNVKPVDLLTTLVDRKDPVQTIENFFDFSFLIKDKRAMARINKEGLPETILIDDDAVGEKSRRQMVLSLSIADLRALSKLLPDDADTPLHRDDPLYAAKNAREQADILAKRMDDELAAKKSKPKKRKGEADTTGEEGATGISSSSRETAQRSRRKVSAEYDE